MASTPSASALSAVLRCRRSIWTRSPPAKRPAASAYGLGLSGGPGRDSAAEHGRSKASAWEAFVHGERVAVGRLSVGCTRVDGNVPRSTGRVPVERLCRGRSDPGDAHSVHDAPLRQLARKLTPKFPGTQKCSQMIRKIQNEKFAARVCYTCSGDFPSGVWRVSMGSTCGMETRTSPSVLWIKVKNSCVSWSALVSQILVYRLGLFRSSRTQLGQQDQDHKDEEEVQVNGQISGPADFLDDCYSENKITEDRPD